MRLLLISILSVLIFPVYAQNNFGGLFPAPGISYSLNENWQLIGKIESMHTLYSIEEDEIIWNYEHYRTDFQGFISRKINPFWKAALGYQLRITDPENEHRALQQLSYVQRFSRFRLGHRFRADQTFSSIDAPEYRGRYRLASQIPIKGISLNNREPYLAISDEALFSLQSGSTGFENRLVIAIGYYFENNNKMEVGIDYRTDKFFTEDFRQRTWLKIGYSINL